MPSTPTETATIRIVCLSDTRGASPIDGDFDLDRGDVLVHAGNLTDRGTCAELENTLNWIAKSDFAVKVVIAGTRDTVIGQQSIDTASAYHDNLLKSNVQRCRQLLQTARCPSNVIYLNHSSVDITMWHARDRASTLRIFGSPRAFRSTSAKSHYVFSCPQEHEGPSEDGESLSWDSIPSGTDIVVTHTPAYGHLDLNGKGQLTGCEDLRRALWRVTPSVSIAGSVSESYGAELIEWDKRTRLPREVLPNTPLNVNQVIQCATAGVALHRDTALPACMTGHLNARRPKTGPGVAVPRKTVFVNPTILARSWAERGPKVYNPPITVDLILPVHSEDGTDGQVRIRNVDPFASPRHSPRVTRGDTSDLDDVKRYCMSPQVTSGRQRADLATAASVQHDLEAIQTRREQDVRSRPGSGADTALNARLTNKAGTGIDSGMRPGPKTCTGPTLNAQSNSNSTAAKTVSTWDYESVDPDAQSSAQSSATSSATHTSAGSASTGGSATTSGSSDSSGETITEHHFVV